MQGFPRKIEHGLLFMSSNIWALAEDVGHDSLFPTLDRSQSPAATHSSHPSCTSTLPRSYLYERTSKVQGVQVYGPSPKAAGHRGRAALCTFNVDGLHATDLSTLLDASGVAVRSGHHCTQPVHRHLGVTASARASAYIYNTPEEVDAFIEALEDTIKFFREIA
eukprot:1150117-Pelagomonas_calceolata.AAC.11